MCRLSLIGSIFSIFVAGNVFAQLPVSSALHWESVSIEFSNFEIVTASKMSQGISGSVPEDPKPLVINKLYPPETLVFVKFDYNTDFVPNSDPASIEKIVVGAEITKKGFGGYGPCTLQEPSGTSYVWLSGVYSNDKSKRAEIETRLNVYGTRNDKTKPAGAKVPDSIKFEMLIDKWATLSETQLDAIKAMYRRLQELEQRVKVLEARLGGS